MIFEKGKPVIFSITGQLRLVAIWQKENIKFVQTTGWTPRIQKISFDENGVCDHYNDYYNNIFTTKERIVRQ